MSAGSRPKARLASSGLKYWLVEPIPYCNVGLLFMVMILGVHDNLAFGLAMYMIQTYIDLV